MRRRTLLLGALAVPLPPTPLLAQTHRSRNTPADRSVHAVAQKAGIATQSFYTSGPEGYEATFKAIRSSGADASQIAGGPIFANDAHRLAELALKARMPTICECRDMARSGCPIGYG